MSDPQAGPGEPDGLHKFSDHQNGESHWALMQASLRVFETSYGLLQQAADLRQELYRLYLLRLDSGIQAAEFFAAPDDQRAAEVAACVHEACSDAFDGYELWRGVTRVAPDKHERHGSGNRSFEDMIRLHQDIIADLEERLQRAFACVNRSRRLVELSARLRAR